MKKFKNYIEDVIINPLNPTLKVLQMLNQRLQQDVDKDMVRTVSVNSQLVQFNAFDLIDLQ